MKHLWAENKNNVPQPYPDNVFQSEVPLKLKGEEKFYQSNTLRLKSFRYLDSLQKITDSILNSVDSKNKT